MHAFWHITATFALAMDVLVIAAMRRTGGYRRYPLLFFYFLFIFCSSMVEVASAYGPQGLVFTGEQYKQLYWTNEAIHQLTIFLLMICFIFRAMEGVRNRLLICAGIATGVLIVSMLSVFTAGSASIGLTRWMTYSSRNLSFCSALLNFVLWSALIRRRQRDPQLLLVSAGLGLDTTGKAIGHSLRWISRSAVPVGNVLIVISHLLAMTLWWYSFARIRPRNPRGTHSRSSAEAENASVQFS